MTGPYLELRALAKTFPDFSLGPLSTAFHPGRVQGVLGPNGAGKTTLLNVVTLQSRATAGEMLHRGEPLRWGDAWWKGKIAYVRESPSFYGELTIGETLRFASRLYEQWDAPLARHMCMRLGLRDQQRVRTLSKGTRVKLGIVAALAHRAELLVLDEPTAGVDPTSRDELHDLLRQLRRERPEVCVLLSSHIFEDLDTSADDVLILRDGQIAFEASREQLQALSLFRVRPDETLPPSDDVPFSWVSDGHGWVIALRGSAAGQRLRAAPHCSEESRQGLLAAVYRRTVQLGGVR